MNEEQLGLMCKYLSATPPDRIMRVILETFLQTKPDQVKYKGDREIMLDKRRKRRVEDMLKTGKDYGRAGGVEAKDIFSEGR